MAAASVDRVLSVGVERDDVLGQRVTQRAPDARLESGALAEVDRVAYDVGAGSAGESGRLVRAAVVDTDDAREPLPRGRRPRPRSRSPRCTSVSPHRHARAPGRAPS